MNKSKVKTVALIGCLDSKGEEMDYAVQLFHSFGFKTLLIDTGIREEPLITPDITREKVMAAVGLSWDTVKRRSNLMELVQLMSNGAAALAKDLYEKKMIDGIFAMGGAQNTSIGTGAMKALPIGAPKVMLSTIASGNRIMEPIMGGSDIVLIHSVADISGVNRITELLIRNAVAVMSGMLEKGQSEVKKSRIPFFGASMLGITTPGVTGVINLLNKIGWETSIFHANGVGGRVMEQMIATGFFNGVLDLTIHELTSEVMGKGICIGSKRRLAAAVEAGLPQVIAPGGIDFIDFAPDNIDLTGWKRRKYVYHNQAIIHIKLTKEEISQVATVMAERLKPNKGNITIVIPSRGFSAPFVQGGPLYDPEVDAAFIDTLRVKLGKSVRWREVDAHINEPAFSQAVADEMVALMGEVKNN